MPPKYSHVKRRSASGLLRKEAGGYVKDTTPSHQHHHHHHRLNPLVDRSISQALSAVSLLERDIARILLIRYEHDIARLFSTRLYSIALVHLPTFAMRCISLYGPSWLVHNHDCEDIKDFFRAAVSMDMRQAGERVATKSVLWSYTALRHFAMSNNVPICAKRGLHTLRLLPFHPALKSHLDALDSASPPTFTKPPHLGSLQEGQDALKEACELKFSMLANGAAAEWDPDWRERVHVAYERLAQTLWGVAREFDVRGYGLVLREKLTGKWCECGCSSDHLGEVCERTVREDEGERAKAGKYREWDGRGWGVFGWETEEEEDVWEVDLDFGGSEKGAEEMTISEVMEWRYLKAEREKEQGNIAFRKGDYNSAVKHYEAAYHLEPELPHYQLNLAAAHLKLKNWMEAEKACAKALGQHRSTKGYFRRARARRMLHQTEDAMQDLNAVLELQPHNAEALAELASLLLPPSKPPPLFERFTTTTTTTATGEGEGEEEEEHTLLAGESQSASSSSAIPTTPPDSGLGYALEGQQALPCPRPVSPSSSCPWPRTQADERRVKIVVMPVVYRDARENVKVKEKEKDADRVGGDAGGKNDGGGGGKGKGKGKGTGGKGKEREKEKEKEEQVDNGRKGHRTVRMKEMKEIVKAGGVVYPSWDRYTIRKFD